MVPGCFRQGFWLSLRIIISVWRLRSACSSGLRGTTGGDSRLCVHGSQDASGFVLSSWVFRAFLAIQVASILVSVRWFCRQESGSVRLVLGVLCYPRGEIAVGADFRWIGVDLSLWRSHAHCTCETVRSLQFLVVCGDQCCRESGSLRILPGVLYLAVVSKRMLPSGGSHVDLSAQLGVSFMPFTGTYGCYG